ncbi:M48 family metalloprotease [Pontibacter sp. JAM-7]|uniref:M48 family metalloprotease n=1 Tax=Pontibacter sp. JAM-7 TaxID=3366581 RepID=UPI003AF7B970
MATRITLLCCIGLWMTGCAATQAPMGQIDPQALAAEQHLQAEAALRWRNGQRIRLQSAAYPVLHKANTTYCVNQQRYSLGLMLHQLYLYPEAQQAAAQAIYGGLKQPEVLHTLPGSISRGRIQPGDQILAINNKPVRPSLPHTLSQLQQAMADGATVTLKLQRQANVITQKLKPELICDYPVQLSYSDQVNGYADGQQITITAGMLHFANDHELALIIAHELAHNVLQHTRIEIQRLTLAGLLDALLISSGIPSPGLLMGLAGTTGLETFELHADRLAIQLLADTGYELDGLAEFWRRLGSQYPQSIHSKGIETHPGTAERYLRVQQQIRRLQSTAAPDNQ